MISVGFSSAARTGPPGVVPYDFDAVVAALTRVQPYAWREFWLERLHRKGGGAPLAGIESAGWHFALTAIPSSMHVAHENEDRELNLQYSLGLAVGVDGGAISDIVPGSPADAAGAAPGSHLIAINGHRFTRETLHDVLTARVRISRRADAPGCQRRRVPHAGAALPRR